MIHRAAALLRKETAPAEPAKHTVVKKTRAVTDSFNSCAFSLSRCIAMHHDVHKCTHVCISVSECTCHRDKIQSTLHDVPFLYGMYSYLRFILAL